MRRHSLHRQKQPECLRTLAFVAGVEPGLRHIWKKPLSSLTTESSAFFPLGGFTPLQSSALDAAAASLGAIPMQVALAWLLQRSPNILLIPGTSSLAHLRENLQSSLLQLPPKVIADLDAIGTSPAR